jgi:uracil-DNA glycosylase
MTREEKQQALATITDEVNTCKRCPLYQTSTHGVPGEGNPDADILFVGEGPGQKEDELGRPFVGAAGKLLEELIKHIGLSRNDVYIANVVKHRPPGNRDPLPDELEACWPYLRRQIEIIEPTVLVTLGRHSLARFLPGRVISEAHGKPYRAGTQVYFPMYHPAAALYTGSLRKVLFDDMAKLPKVLEMVEKGEGIPATEQSSSEGKTRSEPAQGSLL